MQLLVLRCGTSLSLPASLQAHDLSAVPTRGELKLLDAAAKAILPVDPTPSLDEIAAQPDVRHLGKPQPAPQPVPEALRVVVIGSDAALSAVLTRAMRADYLWVEVAFIPTAPESTAARNFGLPAADALAFAADAPARPTPLIRNDAGLAVAGSAAICAWEPEEFTGEIVVDNDVLVRQEAGGGAWGARIVPTLDAPGIAGARALGPLYGEAPRKLFRRRPRAGALDPDSVLTGRAVQAGGPKMRVVVDGVSAKRPVDRVTFYRHLRDLQMVRPD